ncbi:PAS domain-containing sensor histidine kinase [Fastidiosibacter lacustris]|uniref:PAS domain-containing sensor histidine kinase n=1 Tax=Fastidiosibacter lacustris TaxID=2056695 RepID=UPI000E34C844|nr:PAS domain-containing sensor histidine kinase [Fastidiosibacter lacustris]
MRLTSKKDLTSSFDEFSEIVPGGFYWFDLNHKLMAINSFALKTGNAKLSDVIGKTPIEMHPKEMADEIISNHKQVIKTGKQLHCQERIQDFKTGNTVFFDVVLSPLFDENNEIFGVCGISTDITERKRLEEETIRQKNQLEKKLEYQKNYLKAYGYDYVDALKKISDALENIEKRLMKLDIPTGVRSQLNDEFYTINESLSDIYSLYQKINTSILDQEHNNDEVEKNEMPLNLEDLVETEVNLANSSISAEFDLNVSFEIDEKSRQKLYIDYKKVRHIIRTLFANYTKAINKEGRKKDIQLTITAEEGIRDKLYVTFEFDGNMPFLELENDNIRAEHLVYQSQTHIASDKHNFAYDLSLAKYYADLLCDGEELNDSLFEGSRFSFTLPFRKATNDGKEKKFKPTLVE